ncbi:MAG: hypothetical protein GY747_04515 [Planctomycetes bacterium]|nr:hypothetical protein [Planctomycetota bacterium]MCP4771480.1 hypothetical protein [Planctomycetota bacterium]MCP4861141.1 hypothetical protein [Planctomycetota bacterium]
MMLSFACTLALSLPLAQSTPQEGVTLFSPIFSTDCHLLDGEQNIVHTWNDSATPGLAAEILPNGNLLRSYAINRPNLPRLGGGGGGIHELDWNGQVLWDYQLASPTEQLHHDFTVLPNGNVLLLVWEDMSSIVAVAEGRDPASVAPGPFWSERVIELNPATGTIVWEWRLWDHLIQDFDAGKPNFGVVADHPQRVNINAGLLPLVSGDWTHMNSVDYHPEFDQIMLSVRNLSEVWIIDHSTNTLEASTESGGNYNMGGGLLYRWGNTQNYDRGVAADQMLFEQHDAQWVPEGHPGAGNMLVFNNGVNRTGGNYWSSADEITMPVDLAGNYTLTPGQPFGPSTLSWTYAGQPGNPFFAARLSGVGRQPNGNTLICNGPAGQVVEVDPAGNIVWDWTNSLPSLASNGLFKVRRYQRWLWPGEESLTASAANQVEFHLVAGEEHAFEDYILLGNKTGIDVGMGLPGGLRLPLNQDKLLQRVFRNLNTPSLNYFAGQLDAGGGATATLKTFGPLPSSAVGTTLNFAFVLGNTVTGVMAFVSNPVAIEIVP